MGIKERSVHSLLMFFRSWQCGKWSKYFTTKDLNNGITNNNTLYGLVFFQDVRVYYMKCGDFKIVWRENKHTFWLGRVISGITSKFGYIFPDQWTALVILNWMTKAKIIGILSALTSKIFTFQFSVQWAATFPCPHRIFSIVLITFISSIMVFQLIVFCERE